jgi:hypothetical protein
VVVIEPCPAMRCRTCSSTSAFARGQAYVPQMFEAELRDDLVPKGRVPQRGGADPASAWPFWQPFAQPFRNPLHGSDALLLRKICCPPFPLDELRICGGGTAEPTFCHAPAAEGDAQVREAQLSALPPWPRRQCTAKSRR